MTRIRPVLEWARPRLPGLAGFAAPFFLVFFLGLESGGYEQVTRSQAGIIVWWAILLGVATGLLPVIRVTRSAWVPLGILAALILWTALATLTWTQSTERSVIELSRSITLIGILFGLTLIQGRDGLRRALAALGAATVLIAVIALASRFHPAWFNLPTLPENYPKARLYHPVGYWNGLATLMAMGFAALLWSAGQARPLVARVLATAATPLLVLAIYMTASRGGAVELAMALLILFVATPGRFAMLVRLVIPAVFSVVLVALIIRRPELRDNLGGVAVSQGDQMIWLTALVLALAAGLSWLLEAKVLDRVQLPALDRRTTARIGAGLAAIALVVVIVGLASGFIGERWSEFKKPVGVDSATVERLDSVSSGERYDQWVSAIDAGETKPVTGLGPGSYEYWWSRNGTGPGFVRDAHSLYLEGFAELGIPGLLLTLSLVLVPIGIALQRAMRNAVDDRRSAFAAAAAGMVAFAVAAAIDWAWELTVLPVAFFVLVAASLGPGSEVGRSRMKRVDFRLPFLRSTRVVLSLVSLLAILAIAVPMVGQQRIADSQSLYRQGNLEASVTKAQKAHDLMPWSSRAAIQLSLVQTASGDDAAALRAAEDATEADPYNWQAWLVLQQTSAAAGQNSLEAEAEKKIFELNRNYREQG